MDDIQKDCANLMSSLTGGEMTVREATAIIRDKLKEIKVLKSQGKLGQDLADEIKQGFENRIAKEKMDVLIKRRNAMIDILKDKAYDQYKSNFKSRYDALEARIGGGVKGGEGARVSVDSEQKAVIGEYRAKFFAGLMKLSPEHFKLFNEGHLEEEWATELEALNTKGLEPKQRTESKIAFEIAQVMQDTQKQVMSRGNRAGANTRELSGFITRNTHNPALLARGGKSSPWITNFKTPAPEDAFKVWRDMVVEKFDIKRGFGNMVGEELNNALKEDFNAFLTGKHLVAEGVEKDTTGGFVGERNVAKSMSQSRTYFPKSAADLVAYNQEFGSGHLGKSFISSLDSAGRNAGLMEAFGTTPKAFVFGSNGLYEKAIEDAQRAGDLADFKKLQKNRTRLENIYKNIDGTTSIPASTTLANWTGILKASQVMSKLGGAVPHSISDIPMMADRMAKDGIILPNGHADIIMDMMRGHTNEDMQRIAAAYNMGMASIMHDGVSRFTPTDFLPGKVADLQGLYLKFNGMHIWDDGVDLSVAWRYSSILGQEAGKTFDKLSPKIQDLLSRYGISGEHWELYRSTMWNTEHSPVLTPDKVSEIPRVKIEAQIRREGLVNVTENNVNSYYDDLAKKFHLLVKDSSEMAVPRPGAIEKAMLNWGFQPGTWQRSALDVGLQFKSFPLAVMRKGISAQLYSDAPVMNMAKWIAGLTIYGYTGYAITDVLQGKQPRNLFDPKTLMDSMIKGGGWGVYGDYLFGEFNKTGKSALGATLGPTLSQFDSVMDLYTRMKTGEDFGAQALKLGKANVPFQNLFYTRLMTDGLIFWQLQDMVNPGSVKRSIDRDKKENDTERFLGPEQFGIQ